MAAPLKKQVADNVVLVGDAARHVNPITGGGIHTALRGGVIAGSFLGDLIEQQLPATKENLKTYHNRWLDELGNSMWKLYGIKTDIFSRNSSLDVQDNMLYETLAGYFRPTSEFRKI